MWDILFHVFVIIALPLVFALAAQRGGRTRGNGGPTLRWCLRLPAGLLWPAVGIWQDTIFVSCCRLQWLSPFMPAGGAFEGSAMSCRKAV